MQNPLEYKALFVLKYLCNNYQRKKEIWERRCHCLERHMTSQAIHNWKAPLGAKSHGIKSGSSLEILNNIIYLIIDYGNTF